jgi:hypothetical protein
MPTAAKRFYGPLTLVAITGVLAACAATSDPETYASDVESLSGTTTSTTSTTSAQASAPPRASVSAPPVTAAPMVKDRCCCTRNTTDSYCNGESGKTFHALACLWTQAAPNCGSAAEAVWKNQKECDNGPATDCTKQCGEVYKDSCEASWGTH